MRNQKISFTILVFLISLSMSCNNQDESEVIDLESTESDYVDTCKLKLLLTKSPDSLFTLLSSINDVYEYEKCFKFLNHESLTYDFSSELSKYKGVSVNGINFAYDRLLVSDTYFLKRIRIFESGFHFSIKDTMIINDVLFDEFIIEYNDFYKSNLSINDFTDSFVENSITSLRLFGGVGGDVLSGRIRDVFLRSSIDEAHQLIKSPILYDKFIGFILIKYLMDLNIIVPNELVNIFNYLSESGIGVKTFIACGDRIITFNSYLEIGYDSIILKHFQGNPLVSGLRFVY